jgi:hypothetical protein
MCKCEIISTGNCVAKINLYFNLVPNFVNNRTIKENKRQRTKASFGLQNDYSIRKMNSYSIRKRNSYSKEKKVAEWNGYS